MKTASITSYKMMNPTVAKVIVSTTGNPTKDEFRELLASKFDYLAAPIDNSFRELQKGISVGFIRANKEIRAVEGSELTANYRVMSSNILMDKSDQTLWELKSGAGGKYLARTDEEDLSELVSANVYHDRQVGPRMSQLKASKAKKNELVAFVNGRGDLDYGFVLKSNSERSLVIANSTNTQAKVENSMIAGMYTVEIDAATRKKIAHELRANGLTPQQKLSEEEYWKALFSYAPDYADMIVQAVEEGTLA